MVRIKKLKKSYIIILFIIVIIIITTVTQHIPTRWEYVMIEV